MLTKKEFSLLEELVLSDVIEKEVPHAPRHSIQDYTLYFYQNYIQLLNDLTCFSFSSQVPGYDLVLEAATDFIFQYTKPLTGYSQLSL